MLPYFDPLTRSAAEPSYNDPLPVNRGGGTETFSDYLQKAQTRPSEPTSPATEEHRLTPDKSPRPNDAASAPPAKDAAQPATQNTTREKPPDPSKASDDGEGRKGAEAKKPVKDTGKKEAADKQEAMVVEIEGLTIAVVPAVTKTPAVADEVKPVPTVNLSMAAKAAAVDQSQSQVSEDQAAAGVFEETASLGKGKETAVQAKVQVVAKPTKPQEQETSKPPKAPIKPEGDPAAGPNPLTATAPVTAGGGDVSVVATGGKDTSPRTARSDVSNDAVTEISAKAVEEQLQQTVQSSEILPPSTDAPEKKNEPEAGGDTNKPGAAGATPPTADGHGKVVVGQSSNSSAATHNAPPGELSQADRVRFVQRVERAFQSLSDQGSIRLRLSPPELGSLRIELSVRHGEMTARVEAETTTARNLLLDNLPALRERLAQQDIKVQFFDVDLMDRSLGGSAGQTSQYADSNNRGSGSRNTRNASNSSRETAAVDPVTPRRLGEGGQLNVII